MKTKRGRCSRCVVVLVLVLGLAASHANAQSGAFDGQEVDYTITSVGTVEGSTRTVSLDSARRISWAQYALWSNNNRDIYFKDNEEFQGAVHANSALYFSGDPVFNGLVTSAATWYGGSISDVTFNKGFTMGVPTESLASVNFVDLKSKAGLVVSGITTVTLSGTNMVVTNERKAWDNKTVPLPENGLVYVEAATGGSSSTRYADLNIKGELKGRVTFVAERDINITDHVTYFTDPKTNPKSKDALGLISNRDVVVKTSAPSNLKIYAHILATGNLTTTSADGSFGVENYNSGSARGSLIVHGGIAQDYRGAVGTFNMQTGKTSTGFEKNYTYDTRFAKNPPPHYPPLDNRLHPGVWRDR